MTQVKHIINTELEPMHFRTYRVNYTGRLYFYPDFRWVTANDDNYGVSYYQFAESSGTGADPIIEWEHIGTFVPTGTRLNKVWIKGRANATDVTDIEISICKVKPITAGKWSTSGVDGDAEVVKTTIYRNKFFAPTEGVVFTGSMNDIHVREFDVSDLEEAMFNEDGEIRIYCKPEGTFLVNRYFPHEVILEFQIV